MFKAKQNQFQIFIGFSPAKNVQLGNELIHRIRQIEIPLATSKVKLLHDFMIGNKITIFFTEILMRKDSSPSFFQE